MRQMRGVGLVLTAQVFAAEKALRAEGLDHQKRDGQDNQSADKREKNREARQQPEMNRGPETRKCTRGKPHAKNHG